MNDDPEMCSSIPDPGGMRAGVQPEARSRAAPCGSLDRLRLDQDKDAAEPGGNLAFTLTVVADTQLLRAAGSSLWNEVLGRMNPSDMRDCASPPSQWIQKREQSAQASGAPARAGQLCPLPGLTFPCLHYTAGLGWWFSSSFSWWN